MNTVPPSPSPDLVNAQCSLGELATTYAGASRVLQRYGLDFCCRGQQTVEQACAAKGLDTNGLLAELRAELAPLSAEERWHEKPTPELVQHIVARYHEGHRAELPRLIRMATKVEAVHGEKDTCPRGLAALLQQIAEELEDHMQKEEQVLFPLLVSGAAEHARAPITVMEREHDQHGENLADVRRLVHDFVPPEEACGTWRALYLGLAELERDVMEHIALENHVLFPRALRA